MPTKRKPASSDHTQVRTASKISGTPFNQKSVPTGDRFRKNAVALLRPDLHDPTDLSVQTPDNYAERGIKILSSLYAWRPPRRRYPFEKPLLWTVVTSVAAIAVVLSLNAIGSRYVGDLPPTHRFRPLFCQFLAAQSFVGFDTGQYAIIARCTQVSPINISV